VLYLTGLVLQSSEGVQTMAPIAAGVVVAGLIVTLVFTRVVGSRARTRRTKARDNQGPSALPEQ